MPNKKGKKPSRNRRLTVVMTGLVTAATTWTAATSNGTHVTNVPRDPARCVIVLHSRF